MNAAKLGAIAALIYLDPADYEGMSEETELYGHVSYIEEKHLYAFYDFLFLWWHHTRRKASTDIFI